MCSPRAGFSLRAEKRVEAGGIVIVEDIVSVQYGKTIVFASSDCGESCRGVGGAESAGDVGVCSRQDIMFLL